jgi:hypothetical protein
VLLNQHLSQTMPLTSAYIPRKSILKPGSSAKLLAMLFLQVQMVWAHPPNFEK